MNDQMVAWNVGYVVAIAIGVGLFAYVFASTRKGPAEEKLDVGAWKKRENAWLYVVIAGLIVMAFLTLVEQQIPWTASAKDGRAVANVSAQQFGFVFETPPAFKAGQQIEFRVRSTDVSHGFAVYGPDDVFITQAQSLPDHTTSLYMTPTKPGKYTIRCFEYCGVGHHVMVASFEVSA